MGIRDFVMRVSGLPLRSVGRIAVILAVAAAIVAVSLEGRDKAPSPGTSVGAAKVWEHADPLAQELARCHAIGLAAKDDSAGALAWAENRRRFFQVTPPSPPPAEAK